MKSVFRNNFAIFLVLIAIFLFLAFLFRNNQNKPLEGAAHTTFSPVARVFSALGYWLSDKFHFITSISDLKDQNQTLSEENIRLKSQIALLKDIKQENEALREELKLAPRNDYALEAAVVIGKDMAGQSDIIYIDKGTNQGIKEGMAVVVGEGNLIGKVWKANSNDAAVELILNKESRINAEIEGMGEKGIVRGDYGTSVILDMIPQTVEVKQGDAVITSGLGSSMPRGLLIGYIKETMPTADQLFQRASLILPTQPQKIRLVWIIKN